MPGTHKVTKSSSLGSVKHGPTTPLIMDQDDIIALTQNVKDFSDALAKLKTIFTEKIESGDEVKVITHERLGGVLCILKNVLQGYPALHSTDLFSSSATLIAKIKGHDYDVYFDSEDIHSFCDAIDKLALAFSSSVSEYLMGDVMPEMICDGKTKSYDNLTKIGKETQSEVPVNGYPGRQLSGEDIDSTLVHLETGLDLALQRAKAWSKYARDIMTYIEKKAQLESEYSRSLSKLVQSTKQSLTDEGFLPLQSVYYTVLNQDVDYASSCQATQTLLLTNKFVEPLASRRAEHDKVRKGVKDCWLREVKKMHDTVSNLRKAQALYANRQQDYERAREAFAKADTDKQEKRKKLEDDALHKAAEAETTYKACVAETNYRHKELEKTKGEFLAKIREQIELCDQVMRTVTVEYFQLLHTVSAPLPVQYHTLCETSKNYEVGSQFAEYVRRLPVPNTKSELFVFEPYQHSLKSHDGRKPSTQSNGSTASDLGEPSNEGSPSASPKKDKYRIPVKAWGQNLLSDTDSASGSSNKSRDSSPSSSPRSTRRRQLASSQSLEELTEGEIFKESQRGLARTMTVGDEALDVPGILKHQQGRRNTTFGVDFQEQVNILNVEIPPIITRCLAEVEKRGMEVKGLYRVSGVKSRVENLCQRFELESTVYLDDIHPNVLSSVLKQYLRHLPEPLLTFKLYPDFINTSKDVMECVITYPKGVERYKTIVLQLPVSNLKTCAVLMHHLQRVASHSDLNQMSAANLGIVFGPTLLKPYEGIASLASLVDTPHQTYCIEMLIASAQTIFGPADKYQVMHGETPVEHIPDKSLTKGNITHGSSLESETDVSKASGASSPKTNQDNIICETSVKSADIT